jgi:sugar transferase EpsL
MMKAQGDPVIHSTSRDAVQPGKSGQHGWRLRFKVICDRFVALCGLLVLTPLLIVLSLLVWVSMGRPILFRQKRPGRYAKPFQLVKFRTMADLRDGSGKLLADADRSTRVGRLLRATSLDELPQLWNVLRGDISLVGPRPLLMEYLPRYSPEQARRHNVMPGITGWAQINGRNALTWEEKFALDNWYVENWSLKLDLRILSLTLMRVLKRDGISRPGHETMPEFMGAEIVVPLNTCHFNTRTTTNQPEDH